MEFWYLGSPYTKHPMGLEVAFRRASAAAGRLIKSGLGVFSPIAHSHPVAISGGLPLSDLELWKKQNHPFMVSAKGLIVLEDESWEESVGLRHEIETFRELNKPIVYVTPDCIKDDDAVADLAKTLLGGA